MELHDAEIEVWFDTIDKVISDPLIRSETISQLTSFFIDLPVFLRKPGVNRAIDPDQIQCVASITRSAGYRDRRESPGWTVQLVQVPRANIFSY